jgi:tetratricopeptide (TPR) repeat protein
LVDIQRGELWRDTLLSVASDRRIIRRYLSLQSRSDVAEAVVNLGLLDLKQNRLAEAQQADEEALKIYYELAQKNPETYLPDVARTLLGLGTLNSTQHRMKAAQQAYEEALTIYGDFAKRDPEQFSADVTRVKKLLEQLPR